MEKGAHHTHHTRFKQIGRQVRLEGDQMTEKSTSQSPQSETGKALILSPPPRALRPVRVRDLRGAKRLLSRLISQLQRGEVESAYAKDITYLLSVFIGLVRGHELEDRVRKLESGLTEEVERRAAQLRRTA
jgi:hypothetical protein